MPKVSVPVSDRSLSSPSRKTSPQPQPEPRRGKQPILGLCFGLEATFECLMITTFGCPLNVNGIDFLISNLDLLDFPDMSTFRA